MSILAHALPLQPLEFGRDTFHFQLEGRPFLTWLDTLRTKSDNLK